jgi:hypothetical protein
VKKKTHRTLLACITAIMMAALAACSVDDAQTEDDLTNSDTQGSIIHDHEIANCGVNDDPATCGDSGGGGGGGGWGGGGGVATCDATCDPSWPNPDLICAGQCPGVVGVRCSSSCSFMGPNGPDDPCRHVGVCR